MSDAATSLTSTLADRYTIERILGTGGMATVHLAEERKHKRKVAIKVLRQEFSASVGAERFLREIGIAAQLAKDFVSPGHDLARRCRHFHVLQGRQVVADGIVEQQIALLRQWRAALQAGDETVVNTVFPELLLTINAIASGLRTTG